MNQRDSIKTIQRAVGAEPDGVIGPETITAILRELARLGILVPSVIPASSLDERSAATMATLDPKAWDRINHFLLLAKATAATFGCEYVAISGTRTMAEQAILKRKSDAGGPHAALRFSPGTTSAPPSTAGSFSREPIWTTVHPPSRPLRKRFTTPSQCMPATAGWSTAAHGKASPAIHRISRSTWATARRRTRTGRNSNRREVCCE